MSTYATLLLPASRNAEGEEIHRIMLGLWRANPSAYEFVSSQIYAGGVSPSVDAVYQAAADAVGREKINEAMEKNRAWIESALKRAMAIHAKNLELTGSRGLPQLMVGSRVLFGSLSEETLLAEILNPGASVSPEQSASQVIARHVLPVPGEICDEGEAESRALLFEATHVDLGTLMAGEATRITLPFVNKGRESLTILDIASEEDVRAADGLKEPVLPGNGGQLSLEVVPSSAGDLERKVSVFHTASGKPEEITLSGKVHSPVVFTPEAFDFGVVPQGEVPGAKTVTVRLESPGVLEEPHATIPGMEVALREIESKKTYELTATPTGMSGTGRFEGAVESLLVREGKADSLLAIPVNISVQPDIYLRPEGLVLTAEELRNANTRRAVMVRASRQGFAFEVSGVEVPPALSALGVKAVVRPLGAGAGYLVDFSFPKNFEIPGETDSSFLVHFTREGVSETLTIPLEIRAPLNISRVCPFPGKPAGGDGGPVDILADKRHFASNATSFLHLQGVRI